jgi:exosortase H (IPTLxxWG-CTERM-specific)
MLPRNARRFLLLFPAILALMYSLLSLNYVNDHVVEPWTAAIARQASRLLQLVGEDVEVAGTVIRGASFAVNVRNGCNGLEVLAIFAAAILAHPSCRKILPLAVGFTVLHLSNLLRVAALYAIGLYLPEEVFLLTHTVIAQSAILLLTVLLFFHFTRDSTARPTV